MECNKCLNATSPTKSLKCVRCFESFHPKCAGTTIEYLKKLSKIHRSQWKCSSCQLQDPRSLRSYSVSLSDTQTPPAANTEPSSVSTLILEELKMIRNEFKELKLCMDNCLKKMEEFHSTLTSLENKVEILEDKLIDCTEKAAKNEAEILKLKENPHLNRISELEQWARMNNLEISGIPIRTTENLNNTILDIAKVLDVPLKPDDIEYIHRVRPWRRDAANAGSSSSPPPPGIIVRFCRRTIKEELQAAARAKRGLTTTEIGLKESARRIYLNDHLTPHSKRLLYQAKGYKISHNVSHVWVKNSKIFVRKNDGAPPILINSETDFLKIA